MSSFQEALRDIAGTTAERSPDATAVRLSRVPTPLGPMLAGTTGEGVCLLEFTDRRPPEARLRRLAQRFDWAYVAERSELGRRLESELSEYFSGERQAFEVPVVTPGTDFQRRVWTALREIPYGETRSYGDQARMIDAPTAVRAVARANGANRIAIVVPCHRVIGADGTLTGYGGGIRRKRFLLEHERKHGGWQLSAL